MINLKGKWSQKKHIEFLKYLESFADSKYKVFNCKLINDNSIEYIGVRTPILRNIAKIIAHSDYKGFIKYNTGKYYEERAIQGFIIGYANVNYQELMEMIKDYIPFISNWALTDMPIKKFKQIIENKDKAFEEILKFIKSDNPWEVRFGLVFLLNIYVEEKYISKILDICNSINIKHVCCTNSTIPYYVKMGNAWLISECYIKYPDLTEPFLRCKSLDAWTQNKAIQKIKDSLRVSNNEKRKVEYYKIIIY